MTNALENTFGAMAIALSDDIFSSIQANGLVQSEAEAIGHLGHAPGLAISHLADAISLSHAATVRLVARLEDRGLVERSPSETDGRTVLLKLSERGQELHARQMGQRQDKLRTALKALSSDEQAMLSFLSTKLLNALLRDENHAFRVCRLCNRQVCANCPVETEMMRREEVQC
ncbi:MAG: MarR family winged helix-turn-helix transcriptional regulator [Paracoccaceae bacterium]